MASTDRVPRSVYFLGDGLLFDEAIAQMLVSVTNLRVIKRGYVDEAMFWLISMAGSRMSFY